MFWSLQKGFNFSMFFSFVFIILRGVSILKQSHPEIGKLIILKKIINLRIISRSHMRSSNLLHSSLKWQTYGLCTSLCLKSSIFTIGWTSLKIALYNNWFYPARLDNTYYPRFNCLMFFLHFLTKLIQERFKFCQYILALLFNSFSFRSNIILSELRWKIIKFLGI